MDNKHSRLKKIIDLIAENRKIHISVHDVVGVLESNSELALPWGNVIQDCPFCISAKQSFKGHTMCMKCKALSLDKCRREKAPYRGECYLGIHQIVWPVIWYDDVVCIIYVSNMMLSEQVEQNKLRFKRMNRFTKIRSYVLEERLADVDMVDDDEKYYEAASAINDVILRVLEKNNYVINRTKNHVINALLNYCERSYSNNLKLVLLAKVYYMNSDYLCKLFKKEVGMSFSEYLNRVRVDKAMALMRMTDKKIIDIAYDVGYTSDTYFIRAFKKITGITPKQYQLSQKKSES